MESEYQDLGLNMKQLLGQLNAARNEINNLRQHIKSLRYMHEKDVNNIRYLLELCKNDTTVLQAKKLPSESAKPSTSNDNDFLKLKPIGIISTCFPSKRGTPRQPGVSGKVQGKVELLNSVFTNPDHALEGLQDFSHMWILFHFHRNESTHVRAKVAPPRLNGIRTGVFSTRSPHRPCPIGLSLVKILKIENYTIYFEGVDMVDQTPVLDIKPYIPQYDSPLHIEKLCNRSAESEESIVENADEYDCSNRDQKLNPRNGTRETDISRDEELALRLQAEEFQEYPNYKHYLELRRYPEQLMNFASDEVLQDNEGDNSRETLHSARGIESVTRTNVITSRDNNAHLSDSTNTRNISNRLESVTLDGQNTEDSAYEDPQRESQTSRNSRLLDGADGPSTVCGTDLDLLHRRALNPRVDNSPVRMGVREAPDGEEGFQPSSLTISQTLSNFRGDRTSSDNDLVDSGENMSSEVRVPDWISRPRTNTLSVVFNERALTQLNEILDDKADEKKRAIENVLREDPRSVYLRQRWGNQFYTFLIHDLHITCKFDDGRGIVTVFQVRHAGRICECGEPEWQCLGHSPLS